MDRNSTTQPLSVPPSIAGMLSAASEIAKLVGPIVQNSKDAPSILLTVYTEVNEFRLILSSLQSLLEKLPTFSPIRRELIQIDHFIVTLTDSVLVFSELNPLIKPLQAAYGALLPFHIRIQWSVKRSEASNVVARLQKHKIAIALMMDILQRYPSH